MDVTDPEAPLSASGALRLFAADAPDRVALEVDDARFTYAELDAAADAVAGRLLHELGDGHHHVLVCIESTWELLVATMALARAGAVSVPVDPTTPPERLAALAARAECVWALSDLDLTLGDVPVRRPTAIAAAGPAGEPVDRQPGEIVSIAFTSGSTGEPKGILVGRAQRPTGTRTANLSDAHEVPEAPRAGLLAAGSTGMVELTLQNYVLIGATIAAYEIRRRGIVGFGGWLRDAGVAGIPLIPTIARHLVAAWPEELVATGVYAVFLTGETATWADVAALRARLEPGATIFNFYGTTETGPCLQLMVGADAPLEDGPLPLGRPVAGATATIVGDDGEELPDGEIGELVIESAQTALGYWRAPEPSAATFVAVGDGRRRVRTGDLARRLPDGTLIHHGRRDHVVKIAGNRVELGEVESALRGLDGVRDAAATTYEAAGDLRLAAAIVLDRPDALSGPRARAELARRLPGPLVPDTIAVLDALPLLPGGKVDRRSLPVDRRAPGGPPPTPPRTETERVLCELWQAILGGEAVGVDDDWFLIGGDSLRGARLIAAVVHRFGVELPVSALVQAPTVAALAALVERGQVDWSPLVWVRRGDARPPLICVHGAAADVVWAELLARHLPADQPVLALRGQALDGRRIAETSIEALADRYLEAVRADVPTGPYRLYGLSLGGLIALEMARRLRADGETVELVALGDTSEPGRYHRGAPVTAPRRPLSAGQVARSGVRRARRLWARARGDVRRERERRAQAQAEIMRALAGGPPVSLPLRERFLMALYGGLAAAYMPAVPYPGDVLLVHSLSGSSSAAGWARHVAGRLDVVAFDGQHWELGREPQIAQLAEILSAAGR